MKVLLVLTALFVVLVLARTALRINSPRPFTDKEASKYIDAISIAVGAVGAVIVGTVMDAVL